MNKFERKLKNLLDSATAQGVISKSNADGLFEYAKSDDYHNKGWLSLSGAMGGLGALVVSFGIILIVAKNWHSFSDLTKITGFLILLGGTHLFALFVNDKGYEKTAQALHFVGAGLVLAGIGLIGQIFQLYSNRGEPFLSWFVMVLPLAFLLRSGPILFMSGVAFLLWGNIFIDSSFFFVVHDSQMLAFNSAFCVFALTAGMVLRHKESPMWQFMQVPAMIALVFGLYIAGFSHNFGYITSLGKENYLACGMLVAAIAMCVYLYNRTPKKLDRYFILAVGTCLLPVAIICISFLFDFDRNSHFKHFSFGWTRRIYYLSLMISVFSWIAYFALAFWGVVYGSLNHHRWMLNCNIILIGLGVFTRFVDLVGDMFDTGVMFVICGLFLFAIGFGLEKWRRKLIANAQVKGAENE